MTLPKLFPVFFVRRNSTAPDRPPIYSVTCAPCGGDQRPGALFSPDLVPAVDPFSIGNRLRAMNLAAQKISAVSRFPHKTSNVTKQVRHEMRPGRTAACHATMLRTLFVCFVLPQVLAGQGVGTEKDRVVTAIHASIGLAKSKDFKLLYSVIANDSNHVEVSPGKRVVKGFDEFRNAEKIWGSPDFKAVRYEIRDLKVSLSRSSDVAWFFCILDDVNQWKGEPANWMNTRWTGVLEKRDGVWVVVQQHFSFAAD